MVSTIQRMGVSLYGKNGREDVKMADITKCQGRNCKLKETCYRYTAKSDEYWQAWSEFDIGEKPCIHYWKLKKMKENSIEMACGTCKWYAEFEGVCCNCESDNCTDFISDSDYCGFWEPIKKDKE